MNKATGECMEVKMQDEAFEFEVQFEYGETGTITLDSGAGVHVWPKGRAEGRPAHSEDAGAADVCRKRLRHPAPWQQADPVQGARLQQGHR